MKTTKQLTRLTIFIDETDKYQGKSMAAAIVERAKHEGYAGATVLRGAMGYGRHRSIHTSSLVDLAANMPMMIIIIDEAERIASFATIIEEMMTEGFLVMDEVNTIHFSVNN